MPRCRCPALLQMLSTLFQAWQAHAVSRSTRSALLLRAVDRLATRVLRLVTSAWLAIVCLRRNYCAKLLRAVQRSSGRRLQAALTAWRVRVCVWWGGGGRPCYP